MNSEIQTFYKEDKYLGFVGNVKVFSDIVYVDTRDGTGYDKVITLMANLINKLSKKYDLRKWAFDADDTKQFVIMKLLEGIKKYNPLLGASLSTFLHKFLERKIINSVRDANIDSNNPTFSNVFYYRIQCGCGKRFELASNIKEFGDMCSTCKKTIEQKIFLIAEETISLHSYDQFGNELVDNISDDNEYASLFHKSISAEDMVILDDSVNKSCDPITAKLLRLVCVEGHSVTHSAKAVGICDITAHKRLRRLQKKVILDLLNR